MASIPSRSSKNHVHSISLRSEVRGGMLPCPRGEGPGWKAGEEAFPWDARTGQILNQDGTPTRNEAAVAAEEELIKDKWAMGASAGICAGAQPMGPAHRHRKKHEYLPLGDEEYAPFRAFDRL